MSEIDYPRYAKGGFFLGVTLFLVGGITALTAHALLQSTPGWVDALTTDLEIVGILLGFFSPIVFGVVMPLIE